MDKCLKREENNEKRVEADDQDTKQMRNIQ